MRPWPRRLAWLLLAVLPVLAAAQPVYQWVDENGRTVFSDQPPAGRAARQLQMPAAPSAEEVEAAEQRTQALDKQADELAAERRKREEQRAVTAPSQPVAEPPADSEAQHDVLQPYSDYPYPQSRPPRPAQLPAQLPRPVVPRNPGTRPAVQPR
jgi:hypothetical protein